MQLVRNLGGSSSSYCHAFVLEVLFGHKDICFLCIDNFIQLQDCTGKGEVLGQILKSKQNKFLLRQISRFNPEYKYMASTQNKDILNQSMSCCTYFLCNIF